MSPRSGSTSEPYGLWGRSFRPFFLGLSVHASLSIPLWAWIWLGAAPAPGWLMPIWWHGHEMIFGLVAAAIAGFLLTAAPVWTGGPALTGAPLAALFGLWVAGRLAFAAAGFLPLWLVAWVDGAFLPAVAVAAMRTLRGSGQRHNQALVGIVLMLACTNFAMHLEALGLTSGVAGRALRFAVDLVIVLILVIAGRITPAFTRNAFRRDGIERTVHAWPMLDGVTIGAAAGLALAGLGTGRSLVSGALAVVAGLATAVRLAGWQPGATRTDPLLWSLHAGSGWLVAGLLLVGISDLGGPVPQTVGLHALTAGAIGTTVLAVMTRVGLGHTGRPLELPRGMVACYGLVHLGAIARVVAAFFVGEAYAFLLTVSAVSWAAAFGLFALRYAPILTTPRPDGRPG